MTSIVSAADPYRRKRVAILDTELAFVDTGGSGDPIVFIHGNPTSSFLWRNIIPHLERHGRCLAPDLVGMGESGKNTSGAYRFVDHARYLDGWFEALKLNNATLVVHDWGSALGFHWARRNPARVKGIAYMEAIVKPLVWDEWPQNARQIFQALRSPAGDDLILQKNFFVERILPAATIRALGDEEMAVYRRPYQQAGEVRRPMLTWPREIPIEGQPLDVCEIAASYAAWLANSGVPKLFINAEPGSILTGKQREFCRTWPNQREVTVKGAHFIQEDSPAEIGKAISDWYATL